MSSNWSRARVVAKRGASQPQPEVPVTYDTVSKMVRSNFKEEWLNDWSRNSTGRALYKYMNAPKPKDPINTLKRKEQSLIFRLRTGHIPLNNHLHRIKKNHPSQCMQACRKNTPVTRGRRKHAFQKIIFIVNAFYRSRLHHALSLV